MRTNNYSQFLKKETPALLSIAVNQDLTDQERLLAIDVLADRENEPSLARDVAKAMMSVYFNADNSARLRAAAEECRQYRVCAEEIDAQSAETFALRVQWDVEPDDKEDMANATPDEKVIVGFLRFVKKSVSRYPGNKRITMRLASEAVRVYRSQGGRFSPTFVQKEVLGSLALASKTNRDAAQYVWATLRKMGKSPQAPLRFGAQKAMQEIYHRYAKGNDEKLFPLTGVMTGLFYCIGRSLVRRDGWVSDYGAFYTPQMPFDPAFTSLIAPQARERVAQKPLPKNYG